MNLCFVKQDFYNLIQTFRMYRKPNQQCDLIELNKKRDFHRRLGYSWLITNLLMLGIMIQMFSAGVASLTVMVLYLATIIAMYDEGQSKDKIDMFIYWKTLEMINSKQGIMYGIKT